MRSYLAPFFTASAIAVIALSLGACSPYSSSNNAAEYLDPLLNDVKDVTAIGICGDTYVAVQFQDDAISEYRLPNRDAGETKPVFQWVRSKAERPTYGDAGCLYVGSPAFDDGTDYFITVDSPGHVDVRVRDAVTKSTSFDDVKNMLKLTAMTVHQAVADHQGYVAPQKTWN
jgi:hypothetical protein